MQGLSVSTCLISICPTNNGSRSLISAQLNYYKSPYSAENMHIILCTPIYFISNIKHFLTNLQLSRTLYTTINRESWNSHGGMYEDSSLEWTNRHSAVWITTYCLCDIMSGDTCLCDMSGDTCLCDIMSGDTCLWHNARWQMFMWHNARWHMFVTCQVTHVYVT